ncbi:hypothetical protein GSI_13125 [Ganoderma sinense ZZ0214-1]|uniref:Uncharacterized protein n=1 Tax=Ganoderma sinense ZZ0214-1 TaxID=1077348 RepID=A0A2G8RUP2_9APHY|nr:hypothetical protein GSI_13125 [Ganoderma sinense ZZ0214-1]
MATVPRRKEMSAEGLDSIGLALVSALITRVADSEPVVRETLQVVLVEAGDLNKVRNWNEGPSTFSNRVSSITNASQPVVPRRMDQEIGAWAHVDEGRTCPIEEMPRNAGTQPCPIAFLPLSPTASSLVWSTKPHRAKALLSSDIVGRVALDLPLDDGQAGVGGVELRAGAETHDHDHV